MGLVLFILLGLALAILVLSIILAWEAQRPPRHTTAWAVARGQPVDPGDMSLPFESWELQLHDGVSLPVWEIENEQAESPLTIVFVHGWGQSRVHLLLRLQLWLPLAQRAVLYDLRGHGDTQGSKSRLGADEADDLLRLIERLGDAPVLLVGYSMGAVIAIEAAATAAMSDASANIVGVAAYGPYNDFHTSLRGRLVTNGLPARPMSDLAMLWFQMRGLRHRRLESAVQALSCPLLIIHGRRDSVAPLSHAQRLTELAPSAKLHIIEDGRHLDAHIVDAEQHRTVITEFVQRITC